MQSLERRIAALEVSIPAQRPEHVIYFVGVGCRLESVMFLSAKRTIERHDDEDEAVFLARVERDKVTGVWL
jgi:hypothetical protein